MVRFKCVSAAVPLLAGFLLPGLSWAAAIAPVRHHHEGTAHAAHHEPAAASALALLHGHAHAAGVPDHEHRPLLSSPFRGAAPPPPARPDAVVSPCRDLPLGPHARLSGHGTQALCGTGPPPGSTLSVLRI